MTFDAGSRLASEKAKEAVHAMVVSCPTLRDQLVPYQGIYPVATPISGII